jgi:lactate 2-monooxygenase
MVGWRPQDTDNGYNPFLRADNIGVEIGFTDPVFQKKYKEKTGKDIKDDIALAASEWARTAVPGRSRTWKDLAWLREQWSGPIILKGILTPADAKRAAECGMDGIVVSNHGGREQDGGVASLTMLPKIVKVLEGTKCDVIFDSGVRNGSDIFKALALGAKLVLVGRPYIYGLSLGGQAGVEHVLRALLGELDLTMHLCGVKSTSREDLNEDYLIQEV